MRTLYMTLAVIVLCGLMLAPADAQTRATANQTVTLGVNAIYRLSVSAGPTLSLTDAVAGEDSLAGVTNSASSFSITQNQGTARLSVQIQSGALPAGLRLYVSVPNSLGTSAGTVAIQDGLSHNVINGLSRGASVGQPITYTFSATTGADPQANTAYTVIWTLAD